MVSARIGACVLLLLLAQPVLAQTLSAPSQTTQAKEAVPPNTATPSQEQRDAARRAADAERIKQGTNEAQARANQRMDAASREMTMGVVSSAGQMAVTTQNPSQQGHDVETLVQQTLTQSGQEANTDLRNTMSAVQRENQRRRALRAHAQCMRNATNASQCPCPTGTQQVNGQCVAQGN